MSLRLLLALAVLVLDAWALERLWRPGMPRSGRLRWTGAIVGVPVLGAIGAWKHMRPLPAPPAEPAPPDAPDPDPDPTPAA